MFLCARTLAVCGCRAAICSLDILWKMRDISSVMGLFLAPTVSNYNWCVHVFKSAPATCQYSLCPLKIPIMIKREYSEEKKKEKKKEKFREAKQPIYQNRSVWKQDEFLYSLLKGLFRTEDCGGEDAAEDLCLTHIHTAGWRFTERPWRLLLPPGVCHWINHSPPPPPPPGLTSRGSHSIWQSKSMWVQFPHIGIVTAASMKMWVSKMLKENGWEVHFFLPYTPSFCGSQSRSLHRHKGEWEINEDMPDVALLSTKSALL